VRITRNEISKQFDALIAGERSREEVERWAQARMQAQELGELVYESRADEPQLWRAIAYLLGVGLKDSPLSYLHSIEDFEAFRREVNV
jgi:hypothetical protein